ncbi:spore germination protein GerPC [Neobacillus sp. SAB-20_R2A]|uniref:spore germination protein GerPC n=1 Tax=Neobacillus sp. SAB-20_R2A TaxID=3120519 RepID=UPI003C6E5917
MYQDMNQYIQWLVRSVQEQENRIASLERAIQQMKDEIKKLNEKPPINVERIEYKFDQLKVETLEGTLTIGLNPNDLSGIEDFAVQNQSPKAPSPPQDLMQRTMKIEEAIYQYLETDLPQIIENAQNQLAIPPNESYLSFIRDDILKQLPNRIDFHFKALSQARTIDVNTIEEQIIELIKKEIQNGVFVFLQNIPDNMKGMNKE